MPKKKPAVKKTASVRATDKQEASWLDVFFGEVAVAHSLEHELTSIQCAFVVNSLFKALANNRGIEDRHDLVIQLHKDNDIPQSHPHRTQLDELIKYVEAL